MQVIQKGCSRLRQHLTQVCGADPDVQGQKTVEMRAVQQLLGAADKLGQAESAMRLLCSVPPTAAASLLAFSQPDGLQVGVPQSPSPTPCC